MGQGWGRAVQRPLCEGARVEVVLFLLCCDGFFFFVMRPPRFFFVSVFDFLFSEGTVRCNFDGLLQALRGTRKCIWPTY